MRKLVLGIISVFAVQVGFVALNWSGNEFAADVGRVTEFQVEAEPWPVIRSVRPPYPETIAVVTESDSEAPVAIERPAAKIATNVPMKRIVKANTFDRRDVVFEPKVITYTTVPASFTDRPLVAKAKSETAIATQPQPIKKKRSLIQKTGSVIKKPFVWIKNLVAKID